jgi:hypothetical protein
MNPADLGARQLLLELYERLGDRAHGCELARSTLGVAPGDGKTVDAAGRLCGRI